MCIFCYNDGEAREMKELNKRFKQYRISLDITQEELSRKTGVSVYTIKNFERGSDIRVSTLEKLLNALGMKNVFDNLIIDVTDRPSYRAKLEKGLIKQRAHKKQDKPTKWVWGE